MSAVVRSVHCGRLFALFQRSVHMLALNCQTMLGVNFCKVFVWVCFAQERTNLLLWIIAEI